MMEHFSVDQISRYLSGNATPSELQHVRDCELCGDELTRFREMLSSFGVSVRHWAAQQPAARNEAGLPVSASPWQSIRPLKWALGTLVLLVAVFPALRSRTEQWSESDLSRDAELLSEVNTHIGRTVPAPLEPLMELLEETDTRNNGGRR